MAPSISDFLETGKKIAFSWSPEKAIFRKPKQIAFNGALKNPFFGKRKIAFSWRPAKLVYRKNIEIAFS
jgi:hypothetical protein